MEFNLTADVIFDEDNDRYTLTTPIFPSGAVTIDCDVTRNLLFTFFHEIEQGTGTGTGRLEVEYGGATISYKIRIDHSILGASLSVYYDNSIDAALQLQTFDLPTFLYGVPQSLEVEYVFDTFLIKHADVFVGSIEPSVTLENSFQYGFFKISATNTNATFTHHIDALNLRSTTIINNPLMCPEGIFASSYVGMTWNMIADSPLLLNYLYNDNADSNVCLTMGGGEGVDQVAQFEITNDAHLLAIGVNATNQDAPEAAYIKTYSDSALILGTNDINRVYISASGNIGIGTNAPTQALDVVGTIKGDRVLGVSYADVTNKPTGVGIEGNDEFVLCEEDLRVQVPVGSVVAHIGRKINECITDPTLDNIMGQTVNRDDYIELANQLGIPKSRATFQVPALTMGFAASDFWSCCPVGVIMIWTQKTLPSAKWAWCDGLNGTVDLTGRAPIGATKYSGFSDPLSPNYQRWFNNPNDKIGSGSTYLSDVQLPTHKLYFTHSHTHSISYRYAGGTTLWHGNDSGYVAAGSAAGDGQLGSSTTGHSVNSTTVANYTNGVVYRTLDNTVLTTGTQLPVPITLYQPSCYVLFIQKIVA